MFCLVGFFFSKCPTDLHPPSPRRVARVLLQDDDEHVAAATVGADVARAVAPLLDVIELPRRDGGPAFRWTVCLPDKIVPKLAHAAGPWSDRFWAAMRVFPSSPSQPWRMLLYHDDVVVGAQLKAANRRTSIVVYISFLELGTYLQEEGAWLPLGVLRSEDKKDITAAGVVRAILRRLFLGPGGGGFDVGASRLHFKCHRLIMDESAGKDTFSYKGSSGWRPCCNCKNVVLDQGSGTLSRWNPSGYLVGIACVDASRFDPMTAEASGAGNARPTLGESREFANGLCELLGIRERSSLGRLPPRSSRTGTTNSCNFNARRVQWPSRISNPRTASQ